MGSNDRGLAPNYLARGPLAAGELQHGGEARNDQMVTGEHGGGAKSIPACPRIHLRYWGLSRRAVVAPASRTAAAGLGFRRARGFRRGFEARGGENGRGAHPTAQEGVGEDWEGSEATQSTATFSGSGEIPKKLAAAMVRIGHRSLARGGGRRRGSRRTCLAGVLASLAARAHRRAPVKFSVGAKFRRASMRGEP